MFRHDEPTPGNEKKLGMPTEQPLKKTSSATDPSMNTLLKNPTSPDQAKIVDLLEKNLKWSQIIYEQNRKINRTLMWSAVVSWLRLAIVAVPIILALWFLPPYVRQLKQQYEAFLNPRAHSNATSTTTIDQLINLLPIPKDSKEALKDRLK